MDGSYMLRMRAYVKPRGLKPRVRKLLIVLRLLSLGRHRRRSSCSSVARMSARKTSKLMRPFLDEGDGSLHELAARSLH